MLRALVIVLLIANGVFFGWSRGWLDGIAGVRANGDREPERLNRQVHPERVMLLAPPGAAPLVPALFCVEAGPVATADAGAVDAALKARLSAGAWSDVRSDASGAGAAAATHLYRVDRIDAANAARLLALKLGADGRVVFSACRAAGPAR